MWGYVRNEDILRNPHPGEYGGMPLSEAGKCAVRRAPGGKPSSVSQNTVGFVINAAKSSLVTVIPWSAKLFSKD